MLDSVSELLRQQADGTLSAVDIATRALESIESSQPAVNAYTHVNREVTLAQAEAVDNKRKAGESLGPLAGIPVSVKDVLCTKDMPTTCSSNMLRNFQPPYDATVIEKLRRADTI